MKWLDAFTSSERRMAPRQAHPPILVYYWDGSTPQKHQMRDCSLLGAFVKTEERWYIGTLVRLTLVLEGGAYSDLPEAPESESISMFAKAVRHDADGVGVEFVTPHAHDRVHLREFLARAGAVAPRARTAQAAEGGQALIEFALVLPLILLFIVNVLNFGGFFYSWITVANAARAGVQYEVLGDASVGAPHTPTSAAVVAVVTKDASSLPNSSSLKVTVCMNNNGTVTCSGPAVTSPPADSEAPYYNLVSVDVTYTYKPIVALWDFNALGIHATLPPTTIHRRALMRSIQ